MGNHRSNHEIRDEVELNGYSIVSDVVGSDVISELTDVCSEAERDFAIRRHLRLFGVRNLLQIREVRELAQSERLRRFVRPLVGEHPMAVKGTFFDKVSDANWKVPYHQDLTIAVQSRVDLPNYGPWTIKGGVVHVQPPLNVLEEMLAVRIHLDDCTRTNGPLRVLRGTHRVGRCSPADIDRLRKSAKEDTLEVRAGDAILMRPLLLHASSAAQVPVHRRVVHLEYAACDLPDGLAWNDTR